jgi:ribosomal protein S18 acetylase RimI-like enzyme
MLRKIVRRVKDHGLAGTISHALRRLWRSLVPPLRQVYCANLADVPLPAPDADPSVRVQPYRSMAEVPMAVRDGILAGGTIDDKKPPSAGTVTEFLDWLFAQGAVLWACTRDGSLAGYLWSIRGSAEEPRYHFFPLGPRDAVFLAHEVFPAHRGRDLNRRMTHLVLSEMKAAGVERVYVDVEISNRRSLKSFSRTVFAPVGLARMKKWRKRQLVIWAHPRRPASTGAAPGD